MRWVANGAIISRTHRKQLVVVEEDQMDRKAKPCKDVPCRVALLHKIYDHVKGFPLLLEQIQSEGDILTKPVTPERRANAFKTLVATILSIRCRDETAFKVLEDLWKEYNTPQAFRDIPLETLELLVRRTGTYKNKAKWIKEIAEILGKEYHDQVPDTHDALVQFPGIGDKVANCILVISFGKDVIPVDTHVHRISNRLGWVTTKKPEATEKALQLALPQSE